MHKMAVPGGKNPNIQPIKVDVCASDEEDESTMSKDLDSGATLLDVNTEILDVSDKSVLSRPHPPPKKSTATLLAPKAAGVGMGVGKGKSPAPQPKMPPKSPAVKVLPKSVDGKKTSIPKTAEKQKKATLEKPMVGKKGKTKKCATKDVNAAQTTGRRKKKTKTKSRKKRTTQSEKQPKKSVKKQLLPKGK